MIVSFCFPWLKICFKSNFEPVFELYVKLFVVINKISAKVSSQTQFYTDFEPPTFGQLIKKTLYEVHPTIYVSHYVNYSNSFWKNIGIFTTTSGHSSILMCRMRFVFQKFQNQMLTLSAWSLKFTCSHGNGWSCPNLCVCQSAEYGPVFDFT